MSYVRSKLVQQEQPLSDDVEHGFQVPEIDFEAKPDLDCNLDDEILDFILELISQVNELREGEALVVWKEIF
jgi:hypothetical protein